MLVLCCYIYNIFEHICKQIFKCSNWTLGKILNFGHTVDIRAWRATTEWLCPAMFWFKSNSSFRNLIYVVSSYILILFAAIICKYSKPLIFLHTLNFNNILFFLAKVCIFNKVQGACSFKDRLWVLNIKERVTLIFNTHTWQEDYPTWRRGRTNPLYIKVSVARLFQSANDFLLFCLRRHYSSYSSEYLAIAVKGCCFIRTPEGFMAYLDSLPLIHTRRIIRKHSSLTVGQEMMVTPLSRVWNWDH